MTWEKIDFGEGEVWDFEENPEFVGEYVGKQENVGENNSTLYTFKDTEGEIVKVWGSAILDSRLSTAAVGDNYKIVFTGKGKTKSGRPVKLFDVWHEHKE